MDIQIGSTVGDYQVVGILGAGGMGKVYKVRNVISDRIEALKILLPDLANETELADRFMREIKVLASLDHPNIAQLRTALRVENQLLMVMEFVEGETLEQRLKNGPLPVAQAVDYIRQGLAALDFAHTHGVIHRDIKPANMMITPAGVVKLMDFGIAKAATDRKLTMTGTTMGSLYYMSPEQIQGATTLDARSDLYSMGVSLYELVTGKRPFDGDSQFAIMSAHLEKTPVPPVTLDPSMPAALNDAILMSVAKDPNARFQTAGAFRNALGNVAASPQPARMATVPMAAAAMAAAPAADPYRLIEPTKPSKPQGKRMLWMGLGAVAAAAAVVAVIQFGPWKGIKAAPESQPPVVQQPMTQQPISQQQPAVQPPPVQQPAVQEPPAQQPAAQQPVGQPSVQAVATQPPVQQPPPRDVKKSVSAIRTPSQAVAPAVQQPVDRPPAQQPVQQPVVQPAPVQSVQPPMQPPQPSAEMAAKRKELQEARDQLIGLNARAGAIHSSLDNLRRQQAATGLGLRSDMVEAASLMNSNLQGANEAIRAGDAAAAVTFISRAEKQIEKLEKFLH